MTLLNKLSLGLSILLILLCLYLYFVNKQLTISLNEAKIELTTLVTVHETERIKAKSIIDIQNNEITKHLINLDKFTEAIKDKDKALIKAKNLQQQQINKELELDSSCDNQLKIINRILKDFSNEVD